jgi:opacity protein-like surface antigen
MGTILRRLSATALVTAAFLLAAAPAAAQGFGIGGRMAWITADDDSDADSVRFTGGQIRLGLSPRLGVELSMDRHSESSEALNTKVTETPIQASVLMRLAGGGVSPYLLGGPGWYNRKAEVIEGSEPSVSTRDFGWHAGGGIEIRLGKHAGIHGDYRYTFLDFGDDDDDEDDDDGGLIAGGLIGRFLPGHKGSMWTLGATFYF